MKKRIIVVVVLLILIFLSVGLILFNSLKKEEIEPFYLKDEYYEKSESIKISIEELDNLIKNKETFVLYVYHASYAASSTFDKVLKEFLSDNNLTIYKISYQAIQKSNYKSKIKSYPSFVIIKNGLIIDLLDSNDKKDIEYFKNVSNFENWLTKYIKLKKVENQDVENNNEEDEKDKEKIVLDNVTRDQGKVNIYLFWGDGCPHCETIKEFINNLSDDEKNLFNLYEFEVWKNEENKKVFDRFREELNADRSAVPFIVIGDNYHIGSGTNVTNNLKEAINDPKTKEFDLYFDKIKDN